MLKDINPKIQTHANPLFLKKKQDITGLVRARLMPHSMGFSDYSLILSEDFLNKDASFVIEPLRITNARQQGVFNIF